MLMGVDMRAMLGSWLVRGFFLVSAAFSILVLKGMQADQKVASQMLEAIFATYIVLWMHAVIFIAGSAFAREQHCLNDAVLCRGITRGEYLFGKLLARCGMITLLIVAVLIPAGFWAIRQDQLVRTETGQLSAKTQNTKIEAWEPKKIFAEIDGSILSMTKEVGDSVRAGDVLALIDDRSLFDELEREHREEQNAMQDVENARRHAENARRTVAQGEEALARAERALLAKDLLSKLEQADRAADLRMRKRDLKNEENDLRVAQDAVGVAQRAVETAKAKILDTRKRMAKATVTAPVSGYLTEVLVRPSQYAGIGAHLFTIAPLDEYEVRVPVYNFNEFKRLKVGLPAFITVQGTEYEGTVDRLGAMTEADRWGRQSNYAIVRFKGNGTLGLLGLMADVRMVLPPPVARKPNRAEILLNALMGRSDKDIGSRTASVTPFWMTLAVVKVVSCAWMVTTLTLMLVVMFRNSLIAILCAIGLWHVSNLAFDFAGLPQLSYLEILRTMDKVLGGIVSPVDELIAIVWMLGFAAVFAAVAAAVFITKDPVK
jgi:multidrug resistance efflux pump